MRQVYEWFHRNNFHSDIDAEVFARGIVDIAEYHLKEWRRSGRVTLPKWESGSFPFIPKNPLAKIQPNTDPTETDDIQRLTTVTLKRNTVGVKSELDKLIARVKEATARTGAKAELARVLKVAPARITEWLSNDPKVKTEPGGHYTLELLNWVEQQERQK